MAGEFKSLTIKFKGDATDLSAALSSINKDMRVTTRSAREVERLLSMKGAAGNVDLLGQRVRLAGERCREWQERLDALTDAQESMGERTEENAAQYDHLTEQIERAQARLEAYTRDLHDAEAAYDRSATKLGRLGQTLIDTGTGMKAVGQDMQDVGATLTRNVTAPLVALGTISVKKATEVDTALTGVRKTLDATEEQYQHLMNAAVESSKVQPVDAATILNIEALGAQLGFSASELEEFSRVAAGLDVSTDMGWEDAATNMAQFANIMRMSHEDVGRYGSTIVDLGNHFATTESKVSDMGMRIAAAGASLGMTEADVLGLSAALTSMGVTAEAGGSAISTIMSDIDKDVATGNQNLQLWAATAHMSADEFAQAWSTSPVDALARVLSGLHDATEEGSSMAVMLDDLGIGSIRQTDIMKRLAGNTDLMTEAVSRANAAWQQNTALDTEVANRNASRAAKFQVLANRLEAVAIEVGGPLADAMLDLVEQVEPAIESVTDLVKAFSEMDSAGQRNAIRLAAMAAAAGPLLTVFGKLTSGAGSLFTTLGSGAQGLAVFVGLMRRENSIAEALRKTLQGSETAIIGVKVALGALALAAVIALVAKLTERWRENNRRARQLSDALSGMKGNTEGLGRAFTIGASGIESFGRSATNARSDVDGLIRSIQEHNERNAETRGEAEASIGLLTQYKDVIDRLAGAGSASAQDMALLEWALKGIEKQTGKTYEASDVLAGKYQDEAGETHNLRDEIDQLIDAKRREAEASALQSMLTDTMTERMRAEKELDKVEQELTDHTNRFLEANKDAIDPITRLKYTEDELLDRMRKSDTTYQDLRRDYLEAKKAVEGLTEEEQTYLNMLGDVAQAENAHWGDREKIIETSTKMKTAVEEMGVSARDLAVALEEAGVSETEFARIGEDQFAMMAQMAGGSMETLVGLIRDYNAQEFQSKYADLHVDGYGQVVDANGVIQEWNGTEFVPKYAHVEVDNIEQVDELNQAVGEVKDAHADVTSNTQGKPEVDDLHSAIDAVPKKTDVSMTANVYGKGSVDSLLNTLASANGRSYSVSFTTYNRTVNETINKTSSSRARGAIISHAAGDVLMANRRGSGVMYDPYNRIGEQGAEAIVPLEAPFADKFAGAIAEAMDRRDTAAGRRIVNNYYINDAVVNGDAEIQAAFLSLFDTLVRKGAFNVGQPT